MKRIFSILFAVVLALSLTLVPAAPAMAQPTEVWVDDDYDSSTPTWGTTHFDTIQDGVDAVATGGTVNVAAGTYDESGLKINKSLDIVGSGTVTITGSPGSWDTDLKSHHPARATGTYIYTQMKYVVGVYNGATVTFTNLVIDGQGNLPEPANTTTDYVAGVAFYNAGGSFSACEIKGTNINTIQNGAGVSIYVDTGSYTLDVDDSEFNTWAKRAIQAYGSGITLTADNSTFTGNGDVGPSNALQNGIVAVAGLDLTVTNSTFKEIRATGGGYAATSVLAGYGYKHFSQYYAPANDVTVSGCTFFNTGDVYVRRTAGVWITTTGTAVVEDCTFTNMKGISVDGSNSCDGDSNQFNPSSQDVTISNCTFNGPSYPASVTYYMYGVNIQRGAQVDVEDCTFSGFDDDGSTADGLGGDAVCFNLAHFEATYYTGSCGGSVTGCTFSGCSTGIWVDQDVTPLTISNNNFDGSNEYGVWNADETPDEIIAEKNWWGDCSGPGPVGPGTGDNVSANVLFDPWLGKNLSELRAAIVALSTDTDFTKPNAASGPNGQKQALLDKVDAVCDQYDDGSYRGALKKLERDITRAIERWIVDAEHTALLTYIDDEIEILEGFLP